MRSIRPFALSGVLAIALSVTFASGVASAASDTSKVERASILASPGVVFIETTAAIDIKLTYQSNQTISGLRSLKQRYRLDYGTGSGFVVSPDGTVVTASHVVEPDEQRLMNLAANRLILDALEYGYDDPFSQYRITDWGRLNVLLQQCYKGVACDIDVATSVTVFSAVDVAQTQLPKGAPAQILTSTGFENTDVAVLKVNASNLPTVPLAGTAGELATGDEITVLGFPGSSRRNLETGVTQPTKAFGRVSDIRDQGTWKLVELDADIEPGMSGGSAIDADGRVVGLVSFSLIQSTGESGSEYLRTVDDIKAALAGAGVSAASGAVDTAFGEAMNLFWENHFTASVPEYQRVLSLYDGHPLAKKYLAEAQSKAGTAADVPIEEPSSGFPVWIPAAAVGLLVLAGIGFVLVRGRRRPPGAPNAPEIAASVPMESVGAHGNGSEHGAPAPSASGRVEEAAKPQRVGVATAAGRSRFCSGCGSSLGEDARFCAECGNSVA